MTAFKILCASQFAIAIFMFVFGLVDRLKVKLLPSFLMLPIWISILAIIAAICCLSIGNSNQRRGFLGPNMVSGLRAINIVCVAVAFFALNIYGTTLATLAYVKDRSFSSPDRESSVKEGITAVLMILSVAEMFCGIWLALLDKEVMFMGSAQPIQQQVPVATNYGAPQDPRQAAPPRLGFGAQTEHQQPQQGLQKFPGQ